MVVGKLRMKKTEEDLKSNELYKRRKARQTTRSPSINPPPALYGRGRNEIDEFPSGSSYISRETKKGKSKQEYELSNSKALDELVIQWTTTSSNIANQLLSIPSSIKSNREFQLKLKEALHVENDDLKLESILNDDFHLPRRWKNHDGFKYYQNDLNGHQLSQLESDQYEEYIRKRMWSQSNKKYYIKSKYLEEEQRKTDQRNQENSKKRKIDAQRKAEREADKKLKIKLKYQQRCRDRYFARWEILNSLINLDVGKFKDNNKELKIEKKKGEEKEEAEEESRKKSDQSIRKVIEFEEIPWPIYISDDIDSPSSSEIRIEKLNRSSIHEFLFGHLINNNNQDDDNNDNQNQRKKKILRNAILSYHPDRFNRLVYRLKDVNHSTEKAIQFSLHVSQILNELNHSFT